MTYEVFQQNYQTLSKDQKIALAQTTNDSAILDSLFYDEDADIKIAVAQNELLPLGKLKRLAREPNPLIREMAVMMYERRLIY